MGLKFFICIFRTLATYIMLHQRYSISGVSMISTYINMHIYAKKVCYLKTSYANAHMHTYTLTL